MMQEMTPVLQCNDDDNDDAIPEDEKDPEGDEGDDASGAV